MGLVVVTSRDDLFPCDKVTENVNGHGNDSNNEDNLRACFTMSRNPITNRIWTKYDICDPDRKRYLAKTFDCQYQAPLRVNDSIASKYQNLDSAIKQAAVQGDGEKLETLREQLSTLYSHAFAEWESKMVAELRNIHNLTELQVAHDTLFGFRWFIRERQVWQFVEAGSEQRLADVCEEQRQKLEAMEESQKKFSAIAADPMSLLF